MVDVGGGRGHGEFVGDPRLQRGSGQHHEAARVETVANHPRSRHRRVQGDRRLRCVRRHGGREAHRDRRIDGHSARAVRRLEGANHRRWSGGDRPVVVDRVHHPARIADAAGQGERVGRARREDRPGMEQGEPGVPGEPHDPAGRERARVERDLEVARRNRPIHREAPLDRCRDHRSVELHRHRRVGGHANRSAAGRQLNDLRRAAETPGKQGGHQPGHRKGCGPARAGCDTSASGWASTRG